MSSSRVIDRKWRRKSRETRVKLMKRLCGAGTSGSPGTCNRFQRAICPSDATPCARTAWTCPLSANSFYSFTVDFVAFVFVNRGLFVSFYCCVLMLWKTGSICRVRMKNSGVLKTAAVDNQVRELNRTKDEKVFYFLFHKSVILFTTEKWFSYSLRCSKRTSNIEIYPSPLSLAHAVSFSSSVSLARFHGIHPLTKGRNDLFWKGMNPIFLFTFSDTDIWLCIQEQTVCIVLFKY